MENKTTTRMRWFWPWQDQQEEAWLRQMARQGIHLQSVGAFGVYTFQVGEPAEVIYRLDYINLKKADFESYLQLFHDAGWEYVGTMAGWRYFRKPAAASGADEIYTDVESKIQKYRRVLGYMLFFLFFLVLMAIYLFRDAPYESLAGFYYLIRGIYVVLIAIYIVVVIKIWRRIEALRSR